MVKVSADGRGMVSHAGTALLIFFTALSLSSGEMTGQ